MRSFFTKGLYIYVLTYHRRPSTTVSNTMQLLRHAQQTLKNSTVFKTKTKNVQKMQIGELAQCCKIRSMW